MIYATVGGPRETVNWAPRERTLERETIWNESERDVDLY